MSRGRLSSCQGSWGLNRGVRIGKDVAKRCGWGILSRLIHVGNLKFSSLLLFCPNFPSKIFNQQFQRVTVWSTQNELTVEMILLDDYSMSINFNKNSIFGSHFNSSEMAYSAHIDILETPQSGTYWHLEHALLCHRLTSGTRLMVHTMTSGAHLIVLHILFGKSSKLISKFRLIQILQIPILFQLSILRTVNRVHGTIDGGNNIYIPSTQILAALGTSSLRMPSFQRTSHSLLWVHSAQCLEPLFAPPVEKPPLLSVLTVILTAVAFAMVFGTSPLSGATVLIGTCGFLHDTSWRRLRPRREACAVFPHCPDGYSAFWVAVCSLQSTHRFRFARSRTVLPAFLPHFVYARTL